MMMRFKIFLLALLAVLAVAVVYGPAQAGKYTARFEGVSSRLYDQGKAALDKSDYANATKFFEQSATANPKNALAFSYLGFTQVKLGKPEIAQKYFSIALEIDPNQIQALSWSGQADLKSSDLQSAEAKLQKLARVCGTGCSEYRQLSDAVSTFKTSNAAN